MRLKNLQYQAGHQFTKKKKTLICFMPYVSITSNLMHQTNQMAHIRFKKKKSKITKICSSKSCVHGQIHSTKIYIFSSSTSSSLIFKRCCHNDFLAEITQVLFLMISNNRSKKLHSLRVTAQMF